MPMDAECDTVRRGADGSTGGVFDVTDDIGRFIEANACEYRAAPADIVGGEAAMYGLKARLVCESCEEVTEAVG